MVPKLEACLTAVESEGVAQIVDGRSSHALLECVSGEAVGTRIG
jgi:acetylglutamate kinase